MVGLFVVAAPFPVQADEQVQTIIFAFVFSSGWQLLWLTTMLSNKEKDKRPWSVFLLSLPSYRSRAAQTQADEQVQPIIFAFVLLFLIAIA
jgi:hypothetical protein